MQRGIGIAAGCLRIRTEAELDLRNSGRLCLALCCLTLCCLTMIEFFRSAIKPGHTRGDTSLGVDQKTALADDAFAFLKAGKHGVVIVAGAAELSLPALEFPIAFGHVDDLARTGIENRRSRDREDVPPRGCGELHLHEHAGAKAHVGIRDLDASGCRAGLRVDGSIEKSDSPVQRTAR